MTWYRLMTETGLGSCIMLAVGVAVVVYALWGGRRG